MTVWYSQFENCKIDVQILNYDNKFLNCTIKMVYLVNDSKPNLNLLINFSWGVDKWFNIIIC